MNRAKIEIRKTHGGKEIVGTIGSRTIFVLSNALGDWQVFLATCPSGSVIDSQLICLVSLECHKVLARCKAGLIDVGYDMNVYGAGAG